MLTLSDSIVRAILFAQEAAADADAGQKAQEVPSILPSLLPLIIIFVVFYFLLIRPQRKEHVRRQEMLSAIKKNDKVITIGGIYGVVTNVNRDADEVTIKVDESTNTKLRMSLSSISRVLGEESEK